MKLKCDLHKRRVVTVDGRFVHRNGDGARCPSPTATIGSETFDPGLVFRPPRSVRSGKQETSAEDTE